MDCDRRQRSRFAEELVNTLTHGIGLLASLIGLPVLVLAGIARNDPWQIVAGAVYGTMLIVLYAASTLYHALPPCRAKQFCRFLDHAAIYLLIAGTYTPFTLGALRGPLGFVYFVVIWGLAAAGIALKAKRMQLHPGLSTGLYVAMGWMIMLAARPLTQAVGTEGVALILAGGAFYTLGCAFYLWRRLRWSHVVWHFFVLGGSVCHFLAVLWYAAGVGGAS
jgi:hemolysin III